MTSYIDFVATNLIAEKEFTIIQSQSLKQIVNGNQMKVTLQRI